MSRRNTLPSLISSRQMTMAWNVSGLHRLAAGLDALGDGDLALAGEQLDRTHLAQIHAHGIVGALAGLRLLGLSRLGARDFDEFALALLLFGFLARLSSSEASSVSASSVSASSVSMTLIPISPNIARTFSICSELTSFASALIRSWVTYPRFLAVRISAFTAAFDRSSSGLSGPSFTSIFSFYLGLAADAEPAGQYDEKKLMLRSEGRLCTHQRFFTYGD
jgi:hypothetical protein